MNSKIKIWVDEAGRWPWLWPVVASAFCLNNKNLPDKDFLNELNDSKKLTKRKREELFEKLIDLSAWENPKVFFWVWVVDNFVIDKINIRQANKEAMRRALVELLRKIKKKDIDSVVIDGRDNYEFEELDKNPIYIVGWDWKVMEIWAASIIAKVFRDKLIKTYSSIYPDFSLEKHQWYGTQKHKEYLNDKSKITWIHRLTYKPVKKVLEKKEKMLLHICCWPDATIPIIELKGKYDLLCFWYDPNIQPKKEYNKRLKAFKKVCKLEKVKFEIWEYDDKEFFKKVKWLESEPEKGKRCTVCYDMRLTRTNNKAIELWIKKWSTVLTISPHKNIEKIFKIWKKLSQKWEVDFLAIDFKKNSWFNKSIEYTKKYNIYRQNYCWCLFNKKK